jgi:hypothetical protein
MTSAGGNQVPAIVRKQPKDLADLHAQDYAPAAPRLSTCGLTRKATNAQEPGEDTADARPR